jgi:flagellar assembly protein FliH
MSAIIKHRRLQLTAPLHQPATPDHRVYHIVADAGARPAQPVPADEPALDLAVATADTLTPEEIAAQAQAEAEAIRTAALAEAAMLREQGWHEGYQAGLSEARAAAAQVVDASIERLRTLASAAVADRAALLRDAERQVLALALAIAEAVIHHEVTADPAVVERTLAALLTHLQGEVVTSLHAHPDDVPLLTKAWSERARSAADRQVQIVADHRIGRGGCRVETVTGAWDGTLATQLERLRQALLAGDGGAR